LGQSIVIENKPGAFAMLGGETAARSPPDGCTVWSGDQAALILNLMFYKKVNFRISDFQPVGLMGKFNFVNRTGASSGITSLAGVAAVDGARKGAKHSYGSSGAGTPQHFCHGDAQQVRRH